jgi:hypothetical protein
MVMKARGVLLGAVGLVAGVVTGPVGVRAEPLEVVG